MKPTAAQKEAFGQWLERTLESKNLGTKGSFAAQIGTKPSSVSHYLKGARVPTPDVLFRMARVLGVDHVRLQVTAGVISAEDAGVDRLPMPPEDRERIHVRQTLEALGTLTKDAIDGMMTKFDEARRRQQGDG